MTDRQVREVAERMGLPVGAVAMFLLRLSAAETKTAMALSEMVDSVGHSKGGARKKPAG